MKVRSPYVVQCHGMIVRPGDMVIVMNLCEGGSLQRFLAQHEHFFVEHQDIFLRTAKQMLTGLLALHEKTLVHRDIKPENIFLVSDESAPKEFPYKAVIGDLGLAKQLPSFSQNASCNKGTILYRPPENFKDLGYSQLGDVWQLGLAFRCMLVGGPPFDSEHLAKNIQNKNFRAQIPDSVNKEIAGLIDKMTEIEPTARPPCDELI